MTLNPFNRRTPRRLARRGQTMILGAVALLVLALITFITFNVTVAVQQRIKLQNYTDAKAFSMAVAEARTLNYMAYTNRAIASAYVGMANVHAYMSEAAMLADLKLSAATIMQAIAGQELSQCMCCWGGPCCFQHCIHAAEAEINTVGLTLDWITGDMGGRLKKLDGPARQTVSALNTHITVMRTSQQAAKVAILAMLGSGSFGSLKNNNMMQAAGVTNDEMIVSAFNLQQWNRAFDSRQDVKRRIMAETVNASRQDFAWNRSGPGPGGLIPLQPVLFAQLSDRVKSSTIWMGPKGTWTITQTPDMNFMAGGRTGFSNNRFNMAFSSDVPTNNPSNTVSSFDWGQIMGTWRHGASAGVLPALGPIFPGNLSTGNSQVHTAGILGDIFNNPHQGGNHQMNLDMSRFEEFRIGTNYPFNQPSVFAASSTDSRVNEYGKRGPWEVASDGSGTVTITNVGPDDAKLTLSNNNRSLAFSKAMVYYHRIGDWSDYPNMFNPFWRAKLDTPTRAEAIMVLGTLDANAAAVVTGASAVNAGAVNVQ